MKYLIALFSILSIASCATVNRVAFTENIKNMVSDTSLYKVQYYVSQDIVLYKYDSSATKTIVKGGIIFIKDITNSETILVRGGTPCVMTWQSGRLAKFKFDRSGQTLKFAASRNGVFNLAGDWSNFNGDWGKVKYGNDYYLTRSGQAHIKCVVTKVKYHRPRYKLLPGQLISK